MFDRAVGEPTHLAFDIARPSRHDVAVKHLIVAMVSFSLLGCFDFESAFHQYCDSGGCGGGGGGSSADGGNAEDGGRTDGGQPDGGTRDGGASDGGPTDVGSCDASLCLAAKYLAPTYVLWAVAAASPNDVWASGGFATWSHWDGVSWTSGKIPSELTTHSLYAVGLSPSYVFIGGYDGIFRMARDGGTWNLEHASSEDTINAVWAQSDVEQFATGNLHWIAKGDRSHWVDELRMPSAPSGTTGELSDLDGIPGHVYAVGGYDMNHAIVWRRLDAGVWAQEPVPETSSLEKVSVASAASVWAVGGSGLVLERQADAGWIQHAFPSSNDLEAVWASSASDVWVGGWAGELWHWDGKSWSAVSPPGLTADFDIFDISGAGTTDLFLAATYDTHIGSYGDQFDGGHVFHYRRQ